MYTHKQPRLISRYEAMRFVLSTEELNYFYINAEQDSTSDMHIDDLLLGAFDWSETRQKHRYWMGIHKELIRMERVGVFSRGKYIDYRAKR